MCFFEAIVVYLDPESPSNLQQYLAHYLVAAFSLFLCRKANLNRYYTEFFL